MRTKKKTLSKRKTENSQKFVKSVRLTVVAVYGGKDFWKKICFTLEWKSEGVMDDDSGDDGGGEDWLRQSRRSDTEILFQRWGIKPAVTSEASYISDWVDEVHVLDVVLMSSSWTFEKHDAAVAKWCNYAYNHIRHPLTLQY